MYLLSAFIQATIEYGTYCINMFDINKTFVFIQHINVYCNLCTYGVRTPALFLHSIAGYLKLWISLVLILGLIQIVF